MDRWEGKVAVVTGASSGIGAAIAIELVKAGMKVAGLARRKERLTDLQKQLANEKGSFHGIACDITNEKQIIDSFIWITNNLGTVYILVNNAGIRRNTNLVEGDTKLWKEIFDTNVLGLCIATREAVKGMRIANVDGHIIHINSIVGHKVSYLPTSSVYPASKYAVTALTETLRQELNSIKSKIKITSISPGVVETEFRLAAGVLETEDQRRSDSQWPRIYAKDVADAALYVLGTPPHVQVHELIIRAIGEVF